MPEAQLAPATIPARSFGGVGLMVEQPGIELTLTAADSWSVCGTGTLSERALTLAQRFAAEAEAGLPAGAHAGVRPGSRPCRIEIHRSAPEHVGLGTGTQLALALGQGLARMWEVNADLETLVQLTGRGQRSALGAHGFARGGFLVESGKRPGDVLAPLTIRLDFPQSWCILLLIPRGRQGLHGSQERQAFETVGCAGSEANTDALCRLVLLGLVPALQALDADTFGEALYDFNQRVGEVFAAVQGGIYSSAWTERWVDWLRRHGVKGVGQSSWGPTVFAVVAEPERAAWLARHVEEQEGGSAVCVHNTRACNRGAILEER